MTKLSIAALAFIGCALALVVNVNFKGISGPSGQTVSFEITVTKAYARNGRRAHHHRRDRRAVRRTTRRVVRIAVLPYGCYWRAPYHYCGGIYYQPIVENGTTVYIVVNP